MVNILCQNVKSAFCLKSQTKYCVLNLGRSVLPSFLPSFHPSFLLPSLLPSPSLTPFLPTQLAFYRKILYDRFIP